MSRFNQFLVLVFVCLTLAACGKRSQYVRYFQHPKKLEKTIRQCKKLGSKASDSSKCVDAFMSATVVNRFLMLQKQHGEAFVLAKRKMQYLQQQSQRGLLNDPAFQKALMQQQQKLQQAFVRMMTLVQEDFAKLIMQAESGLVSLKQQKNRLKTKLKALKKNTPNSIQAKLEFAKLNKQIDLQKRLLEALLTFVSLSTAG